LDNKVVVYRQNLIIFFETAVLKLYSSAVKNEYPKNWEALFFTYNSPAARKFSELSETPIEDRIYIK